MLELRNIRKTFASTCAVDDVSLTVGAGEMFSLLGGSGCGKSTLLRLIAGLEPPDSGHILIDGEDVTDVPPYQRPVNLMFQSYALFPHMNVRRNIEFGLRREGLTNGEIAHRLDEALALVKLEGFADRKPHEMSGGQQQRVALARCLAKRPRLLLLDEPLSALDRKLREHTQLELRRIQKAVGITFVIVTHDQEEALSLSSRLAVMHEGRIAQLGTPEEIYNRPACRYVADFIGQTNFMHGSGGAFSVRPELIQLLPHAASRPDLPGASGKIAEIVYQGATSLILVETAEGTIVKVQRLMTSGWQPSIGEEVFACWSGEALVLVDREVAYV